MKQIKTIMVKMRDVDDLAEFDEKVNAAMAEGWALAKREALQVQSVGIVCVLYAELERQTVEAKKITLGCDTCKWWFKKGYREPCRCCNGSDKWEPKP